MNTQLQ